MENKLLIWDIDGTLLHCGACGRNALNQTFQELFDIEDAFSNVKIGGAMDAVILKDILKTAGIPIEHKEKILKKYGQVLKQALAEFENNVVLPGVQEILDYVKTSHDTFNTITTSNFEIGARIKLASHNLNSYFPVGGFGDVVGEKWDAAAEAIHKAEAYYQVEFKKENVYIIGDTWYDIECAKKLGIQSVAVATGWVEYDVLKKHEPNYIFKDLRYYHQFLKIID